MAQNGYSQISVKTETLQKLLKRKLEKQAHIVRTITWDEFLLEATGG